MYSSYIQTRTHTYIYTHMHTSIQMYTSIYLEGAVARHGGGQGPRRLRAQQEVRERLREEGEAREGDRHTEPYIYTYMTCG